MIFTILLFFLPLKLYKHQYYFINKTYILHTFKVGTIFKNCTWKNKLKFLFNISHHLYKTKEQFRKPYFYIYLLPSILSIRNFLLLQTRFRMRYSFAKIFSKDKKFRTRQRKLVQLRKSFSLIFYQQSPCNFQRILNLTLQ